MASTAGQVDAGHQQLGQEHAESFIVGRGLAGEIQCGGGQVGVFIGPAGGGRRVGNLLPGDSHGTRFAGRGIAVEG